MNEMNNQIQPLKYESKVLKTKYTVNEDGSVRVVETTENDMTWGAREFLSIFRNNQKQIDNIDLQLDKKHKENLLKGKKEIEAKMKEIEPFMKESEKKMIANNQKLELEQKIKATEHNYSQPADKRNPNLITAIVSNMKEGEYEKIKKALSKESYQQEFTKFVQEFRKKKARGK